MLASPLKMLSVKGKTGGLLGQINTPPATHTSLMFYVLVLGLKLIGE